MRAPKRRPRAGDPRPQKKGGKKQPLSSQNTPSEQVRLAVYDGTDLAGFIVESAGAFAAFDPNHKPIGLFANQRDASRAIPMVRR
jgi:hypothetical protein